MSVKDISSGGSGAGGGDDGANDWKNYSTFRKDGLGEPVFVHAYSYMDRCFVEGLNKAESKLGREPQHILDLACGAGDGCLKFILEKYPKCENKIDAIDIDAGQIKRGIDQFGNDRVNWICSDAMSYDFNEKKYDLITAVWLHNFLHTEEQQQLMACRINSLLSENGVVVFLIPSATYRTPNSGWEMDYRRKEISGWYSIWKQHDKRFSRCIFSVGKTEDDGSYKGTEWKPMTCWDPLYFATQFYSDFIDVSFVDTKRVYCQSYIHDPIISMGLCEPWFEVLVGRRN